MYASLNAGYPLRPGSHQLNSCEKGSFEKIFLAGFALLVDVSLHFHRTPFLVAVKNIEIIIIRQILDCLFTSMMTKKIFGY